MEAMEGQVMQSWTCGLSGINKALYSLTPAKASHSQRWCTTQFMECVRVRVCACRRSCATTVWTNISNWAINHCSDRSFNLAEAATGMLFLSAVSGCWVDSTRGMRGTVAAPVFWHIQLEQVLSGGERTRCSRKIQGRQRERKRDLPPCLPISKGHPAFPLPLMQRFQGNGLMGKTRTAWLILAPESRAEWIWKSEYLPTSQWVTEYPHRKRDRRWGAKTQTNIGDKTMRGEFKDYWRQHILLFSFIARLSHTNTQWTFPILVSKLDIRQRTPQLPLALPSYHCL